MQGSLCVTGSFPRVRVRPGRGRRRASLRSFPFTIGSWKLSACEASLSSAVRASVISEFALREAESREENRSRVAGKAGTL